MSTNIVERPSLLLGAGVIGGLLIAAVAFGGYWLGRQELAVPSWLPERGVRADSAVAGETFAMCTGLIDEDGEGVFTLDYLTGDMKLFVLNRRTGKFTAAFTGNVYPQLEPVKGKPPRYLVTGGRVNFLRGGTVTQPAMCAFYVLDENSGKFAAYGIQWNRAMATAVQPQTGLIQALDVGIARVAAQRD
jgi:hypothetical protein